MKQPIYGYFYVLRCIQVSADWLARSGSAWLEVRGYIINELAQAAGGNEEGSREGRTHCSAEGSDPPLSSICMCIHGM